MIADLEERYRLLSKYVKDRRSQEEMMKGSSDPVVKLVYEIRSIATNLIELWKENITENRKRLRKSLEG